MGRFVGLFPFDGPKIPYFGLVVLLEYLIVDSNVIIAGHVPWVDLSALLVPFYRLFVILLL